MTYTNIMEKTVTVFSSFKAIRIEVGLLRNLRKLVYSGTEYLDGQQQYACLTFFLYTLQIVVCSLLIRNIR